MKYLDNKFWKMFTGFIAIIVVSVCVILITRMYQEKQLEKDATINLANSDK